MSGEQSWNKIIKTVDPNRKEKIVIYEFGNKRKFTEKQDKGYDTE
jgi:hypothetical protein